MKYFVITLACVALLGVSSLVVGCSTVVSTLNREATLKNKVKAQENVMTATFDKMWKTISQSANITKASADTRKLLVTELVKGRSASFIKIVQESNPNAAFDLAEFRVLNNTVQSERSSLLREQTYLESIYQEYATMYDKPVSGLILSIAGKTKIDPPVLITSDRTEESKSTGKDNDTKLGL